MRVLLVAFVAPRPLDPALGASVRRRALALTRSGHRVDVLVPVRVWPDARLLRALASPARWSGLARSWRAWAALWRRARGDRVEDGVRYVYRRFASLPSTSRAGDNAESFLHTHGRWLESRFRGRSYDLVAGQFLETAPLVHRLAAIAGAPSALFAAEDLDHLAARQGEAQVRRRLELVPLLLVHGPRVRRQINSRLTPAPRIAIVPHPLDPEFCVAPAAPPALSDPLRLVCVSRFFQSKNQGILLAAADRWHRDGRAPALRLELAGDQGPNRACLEAEIRRRGLDGRVVVTTVRSAADVAAALGRAHAMVLPSRLESFSVAALEAVALGLPVLAGSEVGLRDEMARRGWEPLPSFDVESVPSLIAAIEALAAHYPAHRRRALDLRSEAVREFSESAFVESLLAATGCR